MAGWGAFVGRERELARLQSALAERVRLALVVGDAGIGKTRFVSEGLGRAVASGMGVISGGCLPLAEKLPLLPVADALAELSRLDGGGPFEAALTAAPDYVRPELARLLPRLGAVEPFVGDAVEGWRRERLFAAVAELLAELTRRPALVLLIEDMHWADTATLDFLTYLIRGSRGGALTVVATCRSDEVPLDAAVADWLTHVRRDAGVGEIRLGPLSEGEVAEQVTVLVGATPSAGLVEEVYARAEGHPFFTEQLVVAAVTDDSGQLKQPVGLPARLAELLVARAAQCGTDARAMLGTFAVAGRPLTEELLGQVTELDPDRVRAAVRELTAARLLAVPADGGHRARHALLAEAVAADLLPAERISLHERVARALQGTSDEALAAEAAGHWAAAGRSGEELQARLAAAEAAEHVFAYADAATHWLRAIELCQAEPADVAVGATDVPHLYIRAVDALEVSGDGVRAGVVAEEAYRRFADHPDPTTAAVIHLRAAQYRGIDSPTAGLLLTKDALRLFEDTPPSAEHARAWFRYAHGYLLHAEGQSDEMVAALNRALEVAEAAGAVTLIPQILCVLANQSFNRGEVDDGFRLLARARSIPEASRDAWAVLTLAIVETAALLGLGRLEEATRVGLSGMEDARHLGVDSSFYATILLANTIEGLLGSGRTAEAATLIDPRTMGPIDRDNGLLHLYRAETDLLRGEVNAAARRLQQIDLPASLDFAREFGQRFAEVALWAGRPDEALEEVHQQLEHLEGTNWVIFCGWLLAVGMRACADLAERARACRDDDAVRAALGAADDPRIDLTALAEPEPVLQEKPATVHEFGLTDRELDVLRLLGQGKTNPEIAAALFISPRTAGVHVTHILRKLDATTRVQAATIAERAGLLTSEPAPPSAT
jgi:DNA-binding CsgD family transcriptional regulator